MRPIVVLWAVALGRCMGCAVGKWGVWVGFAPGKVVSTGRCAGCGGGAAVVHVGGALNRAIGLCWLPGWYAFWAG